MQSFHTAALSKCVFLSIYTHYTRQCMLHVDILHCDCWHVSLKSNTRTVLKLYVFLPQFDILCVCVFVCLCAWSVGHGCCSQRRCVTCWKAWSWCCASPWCTTSTTPWCTTWSEDSRSSNSTSSTTWSRYFTIYTLYPSQCNRYLFIYSHVMYLLFTRGLCLCLRLSGGRSTLLLFRSRHPGCSLLDGYRTQRTEKRQYRSHPSLPHGPLLRLYPSGSNQLQHNRRFWILILKYLKVSSRVGSAFNRWCTSLSLWALYDQRRR